LHPIELLVTKVKWKLASVYLEMVLISTPNRCTVCAKYAIGSEIILGTYDGTPRQRWSSGSSIRSVWRLC
jgi:hypothetical protein